MLFRNLTPQRVEVDVFLDSSLLSLLKVLDKGVCYVGACTHVALVLGSKFLELSSAHSLALGQTRLLVLCHGHSRHDGGRVVLRDLRLCRGSIVCRGVTCSTVQEQQQ